MPGSFRVFFGCQRQRGGTSDNPSVAAFNNNMQALNVIGSLQYAVILLGETVEVARLAKNHLQA